MKNSISDLISNGLYDLTHLEINTIVKSNMTAAKITNSPRKLLHEIATTYHYALKNMGIKYHDYYKDEEKKDSLFRGEMICKGSGVKSFDEFQTKANQTIKWLTNNKSKIQEIDEDEIMEDAMILERIAINSATIKDIINASTVSQKNKNIKDKLDVPQSIKDFKKDDTPLKKDAKKDEDEGRGRENMSDDSQLNKASQEDQNKEDEHDLDLKLQDILTLKKINDIGTEKILTQTVIGLDGDITTRISKNYANHPISFINEIHQEAISTSVAYWESLIKIFSNFISKLKK